MTCSNCMVPCSSEISKDQIMSLPCYSKHVFHIKCLSEWRRTKAPDRSSCPICRTLVFSSAVMRGLLKFDVKDNRFMPVRDTVCGRILSGLAQTLIETRRAQRQVGNL